LGFLKDLKKRISRLKRELQNKKILKKREPKTPPRTLTHFIRIKLEKP
jgi:hypothetical protein